MERYSRENPGIKSKNGTRKDTHRNMSTDKIPLWKSNRANKPSPVGKRFKDWDFLSENVPQNDSLLDGLPINKSNMAPKKSPSQRIQDGAQTVDVEPEDEDEDTEVTTEEKREIFACVSEGDIDQLEELLDKAKADINITWFGENLLIAAIKFDQEEIAEFLIDDGVDYNFKAKVFEVDKEDGNTPSVYEISCRQLAYDRGMSDIVELIDQKNGDLFSFVKPKKRQPRMRQTVKYPDSESVSTELADDEASVTSSQEATNKSKPSLPRQSSDNESLRDNDTDSGHHSDVSRREDAIGGLDNSFDQVKVDYRQGMPDPNDEGYFSVSPHSSRRGTPTNSADSSRSTHMFKATKSVLGNKRETSKASDFKLKDNSAPMNNRKVVNAVGSYPREKRQWTPKEKPNQLKESTLDQRDEESPPPALVRTQSPWQDDKPSGNRRQRRLPVTPASSAQVHKPRIMSPPSQNTHRVPKILTDTKIVTLPNKMSFPSLRNSPQATRIDVPGDTISDLSSKPTLRTQIRYGQSASNIETINTRKYDEHFVPTSAVSKRKKSTYRS